MRTVRTLPLGLRPATELRESFASYADRLAGYLEVPLLSLLHRLGVVDEERFSALPVGYGVVLPPRRLRAVARTTRLPEDELSAMLLSRYDGVCCDFSALDPYSPRTFSKIALASWVYFVGSHACSSCLASNGGVWRLCWKLPWSFVCAEHGTLLVDTCPGCDRRLGAGRRDGRSAPAFPTRVPVPTACRNALPKGAASAGRSSRPCGYDLRLVETADVSVPSVLLTQQRVDAALEGSGARVAGETVASPEYFRDLRSLCAMLLSLGNIDDLGHLPEVVRLAFERHARCRSDVSGWREELVSAGRDWRKAPRSRPYTGPPESAALMAAVCTPAVSMLEASSIEEVSSELEPFVERMRAHASRDQTPQRFAYFGLSPRLEAALELCLRPRRKLTTRLGMQPSGDTSTSLFPLLPKHVPQLFWKEEFERHLAALLPGVSPNHARRACSVWLVKAAARCTWGEAATLLGIPERTGCAMANKVVSLLSATGQAERFDARIRSVACSVAARDEFVDYARRRRDLSGFTDFQWEEWRAMCRSARAHPGKRGGRSRQAAAWLWAHLTQGDHLLSPGFMERGSESDREAYRRFVKDSLPGIEEVLKEYGRQLL